MNKDTMPNRNYLKGRAKEWKVRKDLEIMGWKVLRTAGSHGFADLIAINPRTKQIRFIQCKPDDFPKSKEQQLLTENSFCNDEYTSSFEVI